MHGFDYSVNFARRHTCYNCWIENKEKNKRDDGMFVKNAKYSHVIRALEFADEVLNAINMRLLLSRDVFPLLIKFMRNRKYNDARITAIAAVCEVLDWYGNRIWNNGKADSIKQCIFSKYTFDKSEFNKTYATVKGWAKKHFWKDIKTLYEEWAKEGF